MDGGPGVIWSKIPEKFGRGRVAAPGRGVTLDHRRDALLWTEFGGEEVLCPLTSLSIHTVFMLADLNPSQCKYYLFEIYLQMKINWKTFLV